MGYKNVLILVSIAAALAACGKSGDNSKTGSSANAAAVAQNENGVLEFKREALLPADKYVKINLSSGYSVPNGEATEKENSLYRSAFWSGAKADYDLLAYDFLPEYRKEKDAFKRSDIVKANHDRLDAAYNDARQNSHFALFFDRDNMVNIGMYDPQKKGFPVRFHVNEYQAYMWNKPNEGHEQPAKSWGFQILGATFITQDEPVWFVPKDEDEARKVEGVLSGMRQGSNSALVPTTYLGHIVASDSKPGDFNPYSALLVLDGISINDPKSGDAIFTVALESNYKIAKVSNSKVKPQMDRIMASK